MFPSVLKFVLFGIQVFVMPEVSCKLTLFRYSSPVFSHEYLFARSECHFLIEKIQMIA